MFSLNDGFCALPGPTDTLLALCDLLAIPEEPALWPHSGQMVDFIF